MHNNILKNNSTSNPYYIHAAPYINTSAGVRALHLLCHHLNLKGYPSFIAPILKDYYYKTNPNLITPVVTEEVVNLHKQAGKNPIVVYPDIAKGNPLNAKCVVRYLLHYAGFLGGDSSFAKEDLMFTYTKKIGQKLVGRESEVLFMPICNTDIFYPPKSQETRKGSCFYASKYRALHKEAFPGTALSDFPKDSIEITRDLTNSQTTAEVADLLRSSEYFYTYEDTSLITEAILCGCPVVLVKNKFFTDEPLATYELGNEGCTSDLDPKNLEIARESIPIAQQKFFAAVENFWIQLDNFISATQELSLKSDGSECNITLIKRIKKTVPLGRVIKKKLKNYLKKF